MSELSSEPPWSWDPETQPTSAAPPEPPDDAVVDNDGDTWLHGFDEDDPTGWTRQVITHYQPVKPGTVGAYTMGPVGYEWLCLLAEYGPIHRVNNEQQLTQRICYPAIRP